MAETGPPAGAHLPEFFVIGAPRAGTTSMYRYLQEHPGIQMSSYKEPSFFACGEAAVAAVGSDRPLADETILERSILTWPAYLDLFAGARADQLLGEASPTYLYPDHVPGVLATYVPNARVIVCLRQPVERAFSHISIAEGGREVTAEELRAALADEAASPRTMLQDKHDYLRPGLYGQHLRRWFEALGRDRVHVTRYEHLAGDPAGAVQAMFAFLGVDASFVPDVTVRYHQSGRFGRVSITQATRALMPYAQRLVQRLPEPAGRRLAKLRARVRERERNATALTPAERSALTERYFADDIELLSSLTGDDYGDWLG